MMMRCLALCMRWGCQMCSVGAGRRVVLLPSPYAKWLHCTAAPPRGRRTVQAPSRPDRRRGARPRASLQAFVCAPERPPPEAHLGAAADAHGRFARVRSRARRRAAGVDRAFGWRARHGSRRGGRCGGGPRGAKRGSQRLGRPAVPGHDTPTELHHVRPVARARGAQMSAAAATRRGSGAQPASRPDMRALPRAHRAPAPHRRCMPAPEDEEMAEFMLVGDQGRKNGAKSSSLSFCGPLPSLTRRAVKTIDVPPLMTDSEPEDDV